MDFIHKGTTGSGSGRDSGCDTGAAEGWCHRFAAHLAVSAIHWMWMHPLF